MSKRMDDKYLQKSTGDLQNKYQDAQAPENKDSH